MTKREELAEKIFLQSLGPSPECSNPREAALDAFAYADAFLAACEPETDEQPGAMREPDAVWVLYRAPVNHAMIAPREGGRPFEIMDEPSRIALLGLLEESGRERIRLRVYVE